jgi:hypothetical protein
MLEAGTRIKFVADTSLSGFRIGKLATIVIATPTEKTVSYDIQFDDPEMNKPGSTIWHYIEKYCVVIDADYNPPINIRMHSYSYAIESDVSNFVRDNIAQIQERILHTKVGEEFLQVDFNRIDSHGLRVHESASRVFEYQLTKALIGVVATQDYYEQVNLTASRKNLGFTKILTFGPIDYLLVVKLEYIGYRSTRSGGSEYSTYRVSYTLAQRDVPETVSDFGENKYQYIKSLIVHNIS